MNTGNTTAKNLERIKRFRLIDDEFMSVCFKDNIECTELVVRIVLDRKDIRVKEVHVQNQLKNLHGRSVTLDIYAVDADNRRYNIEIQKTDAGAGAKRARYHSSMIDTNLLKKGNDTEKLPETFVIFITEHDVLKQGLPIYHIDRIIKENGDSFGDGSHIIYVNGSIKGEDALGKLMEDFFCDEPDRMNYKILADRTRQFKEDMKGVMDMSSVVDEIREEGRVEGKLETSRQTAIKMLRLGKLSLDDIAECTELSLSEIMKLARENDILIK